jgi:hypothetical protein
VADHLEVGVIQQGHDVLASTRVKVVCTDHLMALGEQPFAEVTADEPGAAGDQDAHH